MKLYNAPRAPSPRRVRIFMAEKGISIPLVDIDTRSGENLTEAFETINPRRLIPVLELDDGTRIDESVAICRYLEALHPEPCLLGRGALDQAVICSWQRHMEFDGYLVAAAVFRNTFPAFSQRGVAGMPAEFPAIPALAERSRRQYDRFMDLLNARLGESEYVAGPEFSIADITGLVTVDFARVVDMDIPEHHTDTRRWYDRVAGRPSASA